MLSPAANSAFSPIRLIFIPIVSGLLTAQTIATLFVYLSNQRLYAAAQAVQKAGYLPMPAGQAMASLNHFESAFWGGLFFTLSIGIGLTLITWASIRIGHLLIRQFPVTKWYVATLLGAVWMGVLCYVNLKALVLFPSLFCLLVPICAGWSTIKCLSRHPNPKPNLWYIPVIILVILTSLWATQLNQRLFTSIRDHVLLSNPVGRSVNNFYYRYTLYAAETFKSFSQKTIRTCIFEESKNNQHVKELELHLAQRDVLLVPFVDKPDVVIAFPDEKRVKLKFMGDEVLETTYDLFIKDTNTILKRFSEATRYHSNFARATFFGLLIGFPVLLYIIVYGLLCFVSGWLIKRNQLIIIISSTLCLLIGILLFLPMLSAEPVTITRNIINQELASEQWSRRVAALRYIENQKLEIARYPAYEKILNSRLVVERYWLARAMAKSRAASTHYQLLTMLKDPHPNVVCQAFFSLGSQRRRQSIKPVKEQLMNTDHWYAQWYGYRALRSLGWHQMLSK